MTSIHTLLARVLSGLKGLLLKKWQITETSVKGGV